MEWPPDSEGPRPCAFSHPQTVHVPHVTPETSRVRGSLPAGLVSIPRLESRVLPGPIGHGVLLRHSGVQSPRGKLTAAIRIPRLSSELVETAVPALWIHRLWIAARLMLVGDAVEGRYDVGRRISQQQVTR